MRILAIEDGHGDAVLLMRAIEAADASAYVRIVSDVTELVEYLDDAIRPPDLILCDMVHPGNGDRAIHKLREQWPDVPIVVVTGGDQTTLQRALEAGANEAHEKAWSLREFFVLIADVIARWRNGSGDGFSG